MRKNLFISNYSKESFKNIGTRPKETCIVCNKELRNDQMIMSFHDTDNRIICYVHRNRCFEKYKNSIEDKEEMKQGMILDLCDRCFFPVRENHDYVISRDDTHIEKFYKPWTKNTVPAKNRICFTHESCKNDFNKLKEIRSQKNIKKHANKFRI